MKKYLICILSNFLSLCIISSTALAFEINYYETNNLEVATMPGIAYTGKGYLKWEYKPNNYPRYLTYYSKDMEDWRCITNESNMKVLNRLYISGLEAPQCWVFETDEYIVLAPKEIRFPLGQSTERDSKIYLMDRNTYDIIKTYDIDRPIGQMSYIDGMFYITKYMTFYTDDLKWRPYAEYRIVTEQKTFCTTDFETWYDYSDDGSIPITNGTHTILARNSLITAENQHRDVWETHAQPVYVCREEGENKEIVYESVDVAHIFTALDLFIAAPSTDNESLAGKFLVSRDGVYFRIIDLPMEDQNLYMMSEAKADKFICSVNRYNRHYIGLTYGFCDIAELREAAPKADVYVQLNDKILGFAAPPTLEDDRTLVPIRFLFEQMGAEVDWDDATQTATVEGDDTVVAFSIDNTVATVNNEQKTMDVPARLIDDKTMVPLRFLSENLGCKVEWDEATNTAIITTEEEASKTANIFTQGK